MMKYLPISVLTYFFVLLFYSPIVSQSGCAFVRDNNFVYPDIKENSNTRSTITVPVVFHIVYHEDKQNLSTEIIESQLEILNSDFAGTNQFAVNVPDEYLDRLGSTNIEFCLARINPDGFPTSGITRIYTDKEKFAAGEIKIFSTSTGGQDLWDPSKYLNVYVTNMFDHTWGWSSKGVNPDIDGVMIHWRAFGQHPLNFFPRNLFGTSLTHEVGHWFSLVHLLNLASPHCNQSGPQSDMLTDTPEHKKIITGCPSFPKDNGCGEHEMPMNFMTSVNDHCRFMFTNGQVQRMENALTFGNRSSVPSTVMCTPCTPISINSDRTLNNDFTDGDFPSSFRSFGDITIKEGVKLTIDANIRMCQGSVITLEKDALLFIRNGGISSEVSGEKWQGIVAREGGGGIGLNSYLQDAEIGIDIGIVDPNPSVGLADNPKLAVWDAEISSCDIGIRLGNGNYELATIDRSSSTFPRFFNNQTAIEAHNCTGLVVSNTEFHQNTLGIKSVNSFITVNGFADFVGGEIGILIEGSHPLGSGINIGDPDDWQINFTDQTQIGILGMFNTHPVGAHIVNCNFNVNGQAATAFVGGDNYSFMNNTIGSSPVGLGVFVSGNNIRNVVSCNEFFVAQNSAITLIWNNLSTQIQENHFTNQGVNIGLAGAIIPDQQGLGGESASNCFSASGSDIVTQPFLGPTEPFNYAYYNGNDANCNHEPVTPGTYSKDETPDRGDFCFGNFGIFNLIDPTGGGGTDVKPEDIGPDSVDPNNPYDPTGPPVQPPNPTFPPSPPNPPNPPSTDTIFPPYIPPVVICPPCIIDSINTAINNVVGAGGDDPTTSPIESNSSQSQGVGNLDYLEQVMDQWINFGILVSLQTGDHSIGESVLGPLVTWKWKTRHYGHKLIAGDVTGAEVILAALPTDTPDRLQFTQVQEVNLKKINGQSISTTDINNVLQIANGITPSRGSAYTLYHELTGTLLPIEFPDFTDKGIPRSVGINTRASVYPNPFTDKLSVTYKDRLIKEISIFSLAGKLLYNKKTNSHFITLDMVAFKDGLYLMELTDENGHTESLKIVKN